MMNDRTEEGVRGRVARGGNLIILLMYTTITYEIVTGPHVLNCSTEQQKLGKQNYFITNLEGRLAPMNSFGAQI